MPAESPLLNMQAVVNVMTCIKPPRMKNNVSARPNSHNSYFCNLSMF